MWESFRALQQFVYALSFHYSIVASVPKLGRVIWTVPATSADQLRFWNNKGDRVRHE